MPLGLIARLRVFRCPAATFAAGLIALQAFLAGLALAQATLLFTPGLADFAVICHGNGGAVSDDGTAPDPGRNSHPCCESCTAAAPPATLPVPAIVRLLDLGGVFKSPTLWVAALPRAARAVRAGLSQAPPSLA
jgi:hypothetical protein